ncbi:hypothetical protein JS958_003065 [Salmonella enterica subsp. enterica serovar Infantis]|nr:hypothetical protein [Salmonella enterica subsp. enterica serovar Javiana]EHC4525234.1 hypothetical protein [Salmonella enterica subsp. enterica serovar Infantis]ELD4653393.1 hypothetical protein [Salmonella enterica subsp. enterica serovar Javiana]
MKKFTIPLYFTLAVVSSHTCAATPNNRADFIRKNAQAAPPFQPSVDIKGKPYSLKLDNNKMVIIPAGMTLTIPQNEELNIITHILNYNGIQEAGKIKRSGNMFILE